MGIIPNDGCRKLKKFFEGKDLRAMTDAELTKEFHRYQRKRLSSGPYFGRRYEQMNEDLLEQFIKTKAEKSPNIMDFFRTMGRFDAGEVSNIHVDCYPRVSRGIDIMLIRHETICRKLKGYL